jgi:hypothetical protein
MFMVLCVIHDPNKFDQVLSGWHDTGVTGITIFTTTGLARLNQKSALRDDIPLFPGLDDLFSSDEDTNRTIFSIVRDEKMVDMLVSATQEVLGNLNNPNTGILVVLPVLRAFGLDRKSMIERGE